MAWTEQVTRAPAAKMHTHTYRYIVIRQLHTGDDNTHLNTIHMSTVMSYVTSLIYTDRHRENSIAGTILGHSAVLSATVARLWRDRSGHQSNYLWTESSLKMFALALLVSQYINKGNSFIIGNIRRAVH